MSKTKWFLLGAALLLAIFFFLPNKEGETMSQKTSDYIFGSSGSERDIRNSSSSSSSGSAMKDGAPIREDRFVRRGTDGRTVYRQGRNTRTSSVKAISYENNAFEIESIEDSKFAKSMGQNVKYSEENLINLRKKIRKTSNPGDGSFDEELPERMNSNPFELARFSTKIPNDRAGSTCASVMKYFERNYKTIAGMNYQNQMNFAMNTLAEVKFFALQSRYDRIKYAKKIVTIVNKASNKQQEAVSIRYYQEGQDMCDTFSDKKNNRKSPINDLTYREIPNSLFAQCIVTIQDIKSNRSSYKGKLEKIAEKLKDIAVFGLLPESIQLKAAQKLDNEIDSPEFSYNAYCAYLQDLTTGSLAASAKFRKCLIVMDKIEEAYKNNEIDFTSNEANEFIIVYLYEIPGFGLIPISIQEKLALAIKDDLNDGDDFFNKTQHCINILQAIADAIGGSLLMKKCLNIMDKIEKAMMSEEEIDQILKDELQGYLLIDPTTRASLVANIHTDLHDGDGVFYKQIHCLDLIAAINDALQGSLMLKKCLNIMDEIEQNNMNKNEIDAILEEKLGGYTLIEDDLRTELVANIYEDLNNGGEFYKAVHCTDLLAAINDALQSSELFKQCLATMDKIYADFGENSDDVTSEMLDPYLAEIPGFFLVPSSIREQIKQNILKGLKENKFNAQVYCTDIVTAIIDAIKDSELFKQCIATMDKLAEIYPDGIEPEGQDEEGNDYASQVDKDFILETLKEIPGFTQLSDESIVTIVDDVAAALMKGPLSDAKKQQLCVDIVSKIADALNGELFKQCVKVVTAIVNNPSVKSDNALIIGAMSSGIDELEGVPGFAALPFKMQEEFATRIANISGDADEIEGQINQICLDIVAAIVDNPGVSVGATCVQVMEGLYNNEKEEILSNDNSIEELSSRLSEQFSSFNDLTQSQQEILIGYILDYLAQKEGSKTAVEICKILENGFGNLYEKETCEYEIDFMAQNRMNFTTQEEIATHLTRELPDFSKISQETKDKITELSLAVILGNSNIGYSDICNLLKVKSNDISGNEQNKVNKETCSQSVASIRALGDDVDVQDKYSQLKTIPDFSSLSQEDIVEIYGQVSNNSVSISQICSDISNRAADNDPDEKDDESESEEEVDPYLEETMCDDILNAMKGALVKDARLSTLFKKSKEMANNASSSSAASAIQNDIDKIKNQISYDVALIVPKTDILYEDSHIEAMCNKLYTISETISKGKMEIIKRLSDKDHVGICTKFVNFLIPEYENLNEPQKNDILTAMGECQNPMTASNWTTTEKTFHSVMKRQGEQDFVPDVEKTDEHYIYTSNNVKCMMAVNKVPTLESVKEILDSIFIDLITPESEQSFQTSMSCLIQKCLDESDNLPSECSDYADLSCAGIVELSCANLSKSIYDNYVADLATSCSGKVENYSYEQSNYAENMKSELKTVFNGINSMPYNYVPSYTFMIDCYADVCKPLDLDSEGNEIPRDLGSACIQYKDIQCPMYKESICTNLSKEYIASLSEPVGLDSSYAKYSTCTAGIFTQKDYEDLKIAISEGAILDAINNINEAKEADLTSMDYAQKLELQNKAKISLAYLYFMRNGSDKYNAAGVKYGVQYDSQNTDSQEDISVPIIESFAETSFMEQLYNNTKERFYQKYDLLGSSTAMNGKSDKADFYHKCISAINYVVMKNFKQDAGISPSEEYELTTAEVENVIDESFFDVMPIIDAVLNVEYIKQSGDEISGITKQFIIDTLASMTFEYYAVPSDQKEEQRSDIISYDICDEIEKDVEVIKRNLGVVFNNSIQDIDYSAIDISDVYSGATDEDATLDDIQIEDFDVEKYIYTDEDPSRFFNYNQAKKDLYIETANTLYYSFLQNYSVDRSDYIVKPIIDDIVLHIKEEIYANTDDVLGHALTVSQCRNMISRMWSSSTLACNLDDVATNPQCNNDFFTSYRDVQANEDNVKNIASNLIADAENAIQRPTPKEVCYLAVLRKDLGMNRPLYSDRNNFNWEDYLEYKTPAPYYNRNTLQGSYLHNDSHMHKLLNNCPDGTCKGAAAETWYAVISELQDNDVTTYHKGEDGDNIESRPYDVNEVVQSLYLKKAQTISSIITEFLDNKQFFDSGDACDKIPVDEYLTKNISYCDSLPDEKPNCDYFK